MNERKNVREEVDSLFLDHITLIDLKIQIDEMIKQYGENAIVDDRQNEYDDDYYYAVFIERPETDEEYENRIKYYKQIQENRKALYESLKKEFGDA